MPTGAPAAPVPEPHVPFEFARRLGLWDSTMVVAGSMIGSGIFIVSAEMSRQIGSPGWLLVAWLVTAALTMSGALSYGELAGMMPRAGGQYVVYNLVRFMHRENQYLSAGGVLQNLAGGLQAVHIGHGDVHDHHVRLQTGGGSHRFAARGCFAAHLPLRPCVLYDSGDAPPYNVMIIHQ